MGTTPRGIEYADSTDSTDLWTHYQALAESADDAIGDVVAAAVLLYGRSVANVGALPLAGDFTGQSAYVEDKDTFAVWDGAAWRLALGSGDSGWQACSAVSPFTSNMEVRKIGTMVVSRGYVARASGSATALTDAANIPAGYRPAVDHYFAPGQPIANAGFGVRGVVTSAGKLAIGMEGASSGGMGVATVWFTD